MTRAATTIRVNGTLREVEAPAEMPLLWALRDVLGLTGTKFGCGEGYCGACTVQLDGAAIRSCQVTVAAAAGKEVLTVEGLGTPELHALQRAWIEFDVPQCGYCQAGQLMSAAALLATLPTATDEQIDSAMRGNLCRCGTYTRIRAAIRHVVHGQTASEAS